MVNVKKNTLERWTTEESAELYGIRDWSDGYFSISRKGELQVCPERNTSKGAVSLVDVVSGIKERGLELPTLLRIGNILDARITQLHETFQGAIARLKYQGEYRGVYPIKVNQQQQVVQEITSFGRKYCHGLEAGSKAELIAAISYMQEPGSYLICNGYKDEEFVDIGLQAARMGIQCVFVIESPCELGLILDRSEALGVEPILGVRIKLSSRAGGHWTESGGDRSVFGLTASQLIAIVDELRARNKQHLLKLLHYHLGSQIPNIRDIRAGVLEACRVYCGLVKEGAAMGILDLGGGLAVDYDGSHTNFTSSSNYSLDEYCTDIVETVMTTLNEEDIPHPVIITESGRATVAYYSVLLFNILDVSRFETHPLPDKLPENTHEQIRNLMDAARAMNPKNVQECLNDAIFYRDEIRQLFKHGAISLRDRALAEQIFWNVVAKISRKAKEYNRIPEELENLDALLADTYYGNFSVFQSLPDVWAIDQLFPIMPIHRLNEKPTRQAILADITCDCDGKIDCFIDLHDVKHSLPLHELEADHEYYLGVFLVGAYQETLGDLHNLLGDTNVVTIHIGPNGSLNFTNEIEGDSVEDVLSYVEYDTRAMNARVRQMAENAVQEGRITVKERREIMKCYEDGLRGYTYFER
ncbi:MAG: biosynthetic arginine decarboxylase [Kiritimatiellae bacterium]|nr:biosynthetic arginine decarboxylase [Kiritimatiellia bacterium]MDD4736935.1 biosynthetic arginine decarboxylase [Kiritimatiellia bacterium]